MFEQGKKWGSFFSISIRSDVGVTIYAEHESKLNSVTKYQLQYQNTYVTFMSFIL